jgi:hypothetical protein
MWAPLEMFARAVPINADDWMFMGACHHLDNSLPVLWQYKHVDTRAYLFLDVGGHAWNHTVTCDEAAVMRGDDFEFGPCQVGPCRDVAEALAEHNSRLVD